MAIIGRGSSETFDPSPGQFDMRMHIAGGEHILQLSGELDMATQPLLANTIESMDLAVADLVTLDLSKLTFMDSTGLRAILVLRDFCESAGTELRIVPGPKAVQRVFEISGLLDRLSFGT